MPNFQGRTSRFIEALLEEGWIIAQDRIRRGLLDKTPGLTEQGVFALAIFTMQGDPATILGSVLSTTFGARLPSRCVARSLCRESSCGLGQNTASRAS